MRFNASQLLPAILATHTVADQVGGRRSTTDADEVSAATPQAAAPSRHLADLGRSRFNHHLSSMPLPGIPGMNGAEMGLGLGTVAPGVFNSQPAGRAAQQFQELFQAQVIAAPGSVHVTPAQLGFKPDDLVMIDVGGEGEKSDGKLKSGSAHALNINAQTTISSTPIGLAREPGDDMTPAQKGTRIANLIQPAATWPSSSHQGKLLPLADGFAGLTLVEGAPLYPYHVAELGRVTDKQTGWIALSVSEQFNQQVDALAKGHGGQVWELKNPSSSYPLKILPPQSMSSRDDIKAMFDGKSSHQLFDVVKAIRESV